VSFDLASAHVGTLVALYLCIGFCVRHLVVVIFSFYRAMHFSAKRGIAIASRLSVRPSVCLSVCNVGEL